jgi:hypothetical protein
VYSIGQKFKEKEALQNTIASLNRDTTKLKEENARLKVIAQQNLTIQTVIDKLDLHGIAVERAAKERHDVLELAAKGIMGGVQDTRDLVRLATRECHGEAMARLDELQRALAPLPSFSSSRDEHDLDNDFDLGRSPKRARYHHHNVDASDDTNNNNDDTQPLGGPSP